MCEYNQLVSSREGEFKWSNNRTTIETNDYFLSKDEWDALINYIKRGYNWGEEKNGYDAVDNVSSSDLNALKVDSDFPFMTAAMYNGAIKKMRGLSGSEGNDEVSGGPQGTIITAELFNDLYTYANEDFKFYYSQCNSHDECKGKCQTGEYYYCCSCDTGEESEGDGNSTS